MIVEDNPEMRSFIRSCIQGKFLIQEAENGREGLELSESTIPDLIISDVLMPEVDGVEMCRKLKSNPLLSHIPVVLLTGVSTHLGQTEGLEAGAEAYIVKTIL